MVVSFLSIVYAFTQFVNFWMSLISSAFCIMLWKLFGVVQCLNYICIRKLCRDEHSLKEHVGVGSEQILAQCPRCATKGGFPSIPNFHLKKKCKKITNYLFASVGAFCHWTLSNTQSCQCNCYGDSVPMDGLLFHQHRLSDSVHPDQIGWAISLPLNLACGVTKSWWEQERQLHVW